jgi:prepilin-type processing-associated H-X9-DG protein
MLVPDVYGFESVKWLKTVALTNNNQANYTYADGANAIQKATITVAG